MDKNEIRQQLKNTALNKIINIYKMPKLEIGYSTDIYDNRSLSEIKEEKIQYIIENLIKELDNCK